MCNFGAVKHFLLCHPLHNNMHFNPLYFRNFYPKCSENDRYQTECIQKLFSEESFQFETPLKRVWLSLRSTEEKTEVQEKRDRLTEQKERLYYLKMFEVLLN